MRKTMIISLFTLLSLTLVYGLADAAVSGLCVNCHTMHNSQGGAPMLFGGVTDIQGALVRSNCLGCHTTDGAVPRGTPVGATGLYPFVMSTSGGFNDTACLAGGFFPNTADGDANTGKAHSIRDVAGNETASTTVPPGAPTTFTWYKGTTNGLTCAGSSGCHGKQTVDDPMDSIKGGHHGTTLNLGYRILTAYNDGAPAGVEGGGAGGSGNDYEEALIAAVTPAAGVRSATNTTYYHNIYKAAINGTTTISQFCANCHGVFHSETQNVAGAWIRHPTDVQLVATMEPFNDTVYNNFDAKFNPYGFSDVSSTTGTKMATCLSCHRAHGTEQYDMLRFKYTDAEGGQQQAGRAGQTSPTVISYGCLGCHSGQR